MRGLLATLALGGFIAAGTLPAHANVCQAGKLMCATTMPIGGFCECTAHGMSQDGTVVPKAEGKLNATAGGCGAHPNSPGCQ